MNALGLLFQAGVVQTVVLGAALLGGLAGALGAFAVLRQQSLLGDALSHATLPGVCLGFLVAGARDLGAILAGAFLAGALAALSVMLITRTTRLKTDAALGIVLSVFFAVGVVLLTLAQGRPGAAQAGLSTFLFGQAAAILRSDLWIMGGVALVAAGTLAALWKEVKLVTFDPVYAQAIGLPVLAIEAAVTLMIALAIVVGLQLAGVILMVALLIAPAAAARQWAGSLGAMVWLSAAFGAASGVAGALVSASARGLATGPVVVLVASALVLVSLLAAPERGLVWRWRREARARRTIAGRRVLAAFHGLAEAHGYRAYPTEEGMLETLIGRPAPGVIDGLERQGLIRRVDHPPETTRHWELTARGHDRAERDREGRP
jgi:manganese/zinc/iron transport system permease protein